MVRPSRPKAGGRAAEEAEELPEQAAVFELRIALHHQADGEEGAPGGNGRRARSRLAMSTSMDSVARGWLV
jgi:hypothetical protein